MKFYKRTIIPTLIVLSATISSCATNQINKASLGSYEQQTNLKQPISRTFNVKFSSSFNPIAYFLAWGDIRQAIKNKSIPDAIYHHVLSQSSEPTRLTDSNYLQIKSRIESNEWSEEAYLIANPDIKSAVNNGSVPSGYWHWYNYAQTAEPSRLTSTAYLEAKAATNLGFSEKAYRMAWPDIDNAIKTGSLSSAYAHWNGYAKNSETTRLSSPRYIKIKQALDFGFDENAYLLAYPDVKAVVTSGVLPNALSHYIDYGVNESRLELGIYQDAKLALMLGFDETRYKNAFPDVLNGVNLYWFSSGFQHFSLYGKYEGRLSRQQYINTSPSTISGSIGD